MSETVFFQTILLLAGTVAFMASLRFLQRLIELKHERRIPIAMNGLGERLERIEQAVESTALEVERISEANRFMAKVLAERVGAATLVGRL